MQVSRSLPENSIKTVKSETGNIGFGRKIPIERWQKGDSELLINWY